jgi:hypothetical protein
MGTHYGRRPSGNAEPQRAVGGTVTDIVVDNRGYRVHTFTTNGTFTVEGIRSATDLSDFVAMQGVEYLVVAGGGGSSTNRGGGGAGGYRSSAPTELSGENSVAEPPIILNTQEYIITVGDGGESAGEAGTTSGGNSAIGDLIVSIGGGRSPNFNNQTGFSGGAGSGVGIRTIAGITLGGTGTPNQGFRGGNSNDGGGGRTGGGGAGGPGIDGSQTNGGPGLTSNITGIPTVYAEGGTGRINLLPQNSTYGSGGNESRGIQGIVIVRYSAPISE